MPLNIREYRLSPLARTDLEDIWLYTFKTWSLEQANNYQNKIIAVVDDLCQGLKIGRPVDICDGYLKYPVGSHFLFYRQSESFLDVIRVLHQRMDVEKHLLR